MPKRFNRFETSGTDCRISSRQQADRKTDKRCEEGCGWVEHWDPTLVGGDSDDDDNSQAGAEDAADHTHQPALEQELHRDVPASCSDGAAQANLGGPLHYRHKRNVRDTDCADDQGQTAEQEEHDIDVALHFIPQAFRLARNFDVQGPFVIRPKCRSCLLGNQAGRTDLCFDNDRAGTDQSEVAPCGTFWDDDRAEQLGFASYIARTPMTK